MAFIHAFVAALLVATALGQEACNPSKFRARGFDTFNFRPVRVLHDNGRQATLYRSALNENQFELLDYRKGVFYRVEDDGSCQFYKRDKVKNLLREIADADLDVQLEIDDYVNGTSVYGFVYPVPDSDVVFRGLQYELDGECYHVYVGISVNGVLRSSFSHTNIEATESGAMAELKDALKQVSDADCTEVEL